MSVCVDSGQEGGCYSLTATWYCGCVATWAWAEAMWATACLPSGTGWEDIVVVLWRELYALCTRQERDVHCVGGRGQGGEKDCCVLAPGKSVMLRCGG